MKKNLLVALVGCVTTLLFFASPSIADGQSLTGTSLSVTGSATIADLLVTGDVDFQGNTLYFGTSGSNAALSFLYSGTSTSFSMLASQPSVTWNWQRMVSGSATNAMQLGSANALTLYATSGSSGIVLDPNGTSAFLNSIAINGQRVLTLGDAGTTVLTQQTADTRYVVNGGTSGGTVIGNGAATGMGSIVLGSGTAAGVGSIAMGYQTFAPGEYSLATGICSVSIGGESTVLGWCNRAEGWCSTAVGASTIANGFISLASGQYSYAYGARSVALNTVTRAGAESSIAGGVHSQTWGTASFCMGAYSTAGGEYSQDLGYSTSALAYAQTTIGQFNIIPPQYDPLNWVTTDELFTIGNGVDQAHPSNALVVKKSGDTQINGKLTLSGTNGGIVVTGTTDQSGTVVTSSTNQMVLIPQQGDLSMGSFTVGAQPLPQQQ